MKNVITRERRIQKSNELRESYLSLNTVKDITKKRLIWARYS